MTSLTDRLRGLIGPPKGGPHDPGPAHTDAAEILEGDWCESGPHRFLVVDRSYLPGHRHGDVAMADALPASDGLWPRLSLLAGCEAAIGNGHLLFVDLETTGLAGGAGTCAFLVGCGWFNGGTFRIRQFFLSSVTAERALLEALAGTAAQAGAVVTYNGKTFDLPLIDTRFVINRMRTPFDGMTHIDMLHPARRLWRPSLAPSYGTPKSDSEGYHEHPAFVGSVGAHSSCRLSVLERMVCGHVREGDVPGFEIPSRYFHYVRHGDARPLCAVLEHNRLDLLSLALLTARAAQLLEEGPSGARTAREATGLGRLYERAGMTSDAIRCYARAETLPGDVVTHAEALHAYAVLSRRARRFADAARAWRRILDLQVGSGTLAREATEALAVHHEHRLRDPREARSYAVQALQFQATAVRRERLHYRLARLDRKLSQPVLTSAWLF